MGFDDFGSQTQLQSYRDEDEEEDENGVCFVLFCLYNLREWGF